MLNKLDMNFVKILSVLLWIEAVNCERCTYSNQTALKFKVDGLLGKTFAYDFMVQNNDSNPAPLFFGMTSLLTFRVKKIDFKRIFRAIKFFQFSRPIH